MYFQAKKNLSVLKVAEHLGNSSHVSKLALEVWYLLWKFLGPLSQWMQTDRTEYWCRLFYPSFLVAQSNGWRLLPTLHYCLMVIHTREIEVDKYVCLLKMTVFSSWTKYKCGKKCLGADFESLVCLKKMVKCSFHVFMLCIQRVTLNVLFFFSNKTSNAPLIGTND